MDPRPALDTPPVDRVTRPARLPQVDVLGVPVHACTLAEAVDEVARWIDGGEPGFATFTGVHGVMESRRHPEVLDAHRAASFVGADGMPLVWAERYAGLREAERVYGPDFVLAFCARAEAEGWGLFLYGGKRGVPERLGRSLRERFPALRVVGSFSPPFRALTAEEDADICSMIDESGADAVLVGLSTPKQELWMAAHVDRLRATAVLGVGAAFDFLAGEVRQAPRWVQRSGFEWLFRTAVEPRRLAKRYLTNNPAFVSAILRQRPKVVVGERSERNRVRTRPTDAKRP